MQKRIEFLVTRQRHASNDAGAPYMDRNEKYMI